MKVKVWAAAIAATIMASAALAQNYPNRPVRGVVAAATGGHDLAARDLAAELQEQHGPPHGAANPARANGRCGGRGAGRARLTAAAHAALQERPRARAGVQRREAASLVPGSADDGGSRRPGLSP